jgi:ubiquinone/menaquinone biosynthesis C-methylase UbiE
MDASSESMIEAYENYYLQANNSKVHSTFCKNVFDIDLSQDGFCDQKQLDFLIDKLSIQTDDICLDIGCGNGKIDNYFHTKTNAIFHGLDASTHAIDFAVKHFSNNRDISFTVSDINKLDLPQNLYSVIISIDTIYFSNDYEKTIKQLYNSLKPNGRIAFFYSEFIFETNEQKHLHYNETRLFKIFTDNNYIFSWFDFNQAMYQLMIKKYINSNKLKEDYIQEGNEWLYNKVNQESISQEMKYSDFSRFTNRYLYIINK